MATNAGFAFLSLIFLTGIVLPCPAAGGTLSRSNVGLMVFRATKDEEAYKRNSTQYDQVSGPEQQPEVVFVERIPSLEISLGEIRAVVITKERIAKNQEEMEELILEKLRKIPRKAVPKDTPPRYYYFNARFFLNQRAAKKLGDFMFSRARLNDLFMLSLGSEKLAVVTITRAPRPEAMKEIAIALEEKDEDKLRAVFSPVRDRVTWK